MNGPRTRRDTGDAGVPPRILLIGLRGSGKSTVGPILAKRLGRRFIDLDEVTLARLGAPTVARAWAELGEGRFREAEAGTLGASLDGPPSVIAAGGGTPTAPGVDQMIRSRSARGEALVVYLRARPAELRARMQASPERENRPSLTGADSLDEVEAVFARRDPLYGDLAAVVVEGAASALAAAEEIIAALKNRS